jgi:hypothetical protein
MAFDVNTLLDLEIRAATSTDYTPVPEGVYRAIIRKVDIRRNTSKASGEAFTSLDLSCEVDDEVARTVTGMDHPTVRGSMILELNSDGGLDFGKGRNVRLGRLREAVDLNDERKPFSFRMLVDRQVKVDVRHRLAESGEVYAEVKAFAKP